MSDNSNDTGGLTAVIQRGWLTAGALAVLTFIEYIVATSVDRPTLWLLPFIITKGGLILEVFMHSSDLKTLDGGNA
ncbi:MAG: hypothetical protein CL406_06760 [Acidimicrobiaceae bacterium]|jgi:cytochrome c oxidase subunit IV|nr:hypothetical protein [Acidimicrobiaceae bacterium]MDP6480423.1 hypothetical protein [Acidimicrobiales bacterium]|tara:strand:+ start:12532 stop:12759 length:228 start_codon:yes stop_codon:yes gene_type:complete